MLNSTSTQLQTQHQLNFELDIKLNFELDINSTSFHTTLPSCSPQAPLIMDHPSAPAHWQLSKDPSGTPSRQPARDKPPSQPALPSSLPQPPPHQIDRNRVEVILFGLPYSSTSPDRSKSGRSAFFPLHKFSADPTTDTHHPSPHRAALLPHLAGSTSADRIDLVPPPPSRLWKTTWVDLSTLIAGLIPQPPPSSVVSPQRRRPATLLTLDYHQVSRSYIISSLGSHLAAKR
ncbi:hypothetical protein PGTUg99_029001 [Puccinia graminis f. sp. tritici]|uniref:Uncharacterized protein n=1 Tax=Puccinia graminis f. sp. tritici TaxID=56615 RepID=A0A5B0NHL8_PUCGR|nr:hypothetical protein PGTUg99_029001 [Puccinia graminis f. sp. tritici]